MWILVSLLVAVVGAFLYVAAANPKTAELGKVAFGCGLLAFLLQLGPKVFELFGGKG